MLNVEGLAVTPAGNPESTTSTLPLKPLKVTTLTTTGFPVSPAVIANAFGVIESAKSGGGGGAATVRATSAVCESEPETPAIANVALPIAALAAAASVTDCGVPGVKLRVTGLAVTPEGNPLNEMLTVPSNPFTGAAFTVRVSPESPAVRARVAGNTERVKSCGEDAVVTVRARLAS